MKNLLIVFLLFFSAVTYAQEVVPATQLTVKKQVPDFVSPCKQYEIAQVDTDPEKIIDNTSQLIFCQMDSMSANPDINKSVFLFQMLDQHATQHFDFDAMSRFALGKHWRSIKSDEIKARFVEGFSSRLIRTYAKTFIDLEQPKIKFKDTLFRRNNTRALVKTNTIVDGRPPLSIDYRLRLKEGKWLVYDILAEGISLLTSFRDEYSSLLQQQNTDIHSIVIDLQIQHQEFLNPSQAKASKDVQDASDTKG